MLGFGSANMNKIVFVLKINTLAWIRQQLKQVKQEQSKDSNKRHADVKETSGELQEITDTEKGEKSSRKKSSQFGFPLQNGQPWKRTYK